MLAGSAMGCDHISSPKWVLAIRLMTSSKKRVSACQVHRSLGINCKTAWLAGAVKFLGRDVDSGVGLVTPTMVAARVAALDYCRGAFSEEETVREVYIAMARASSPRHVEKGLHHEDKTGQKGDR